LSLLSLLSFLSSNHKKENNKDNKYYGIRARRAKSHAKPPSREVFFIKLSSFYYDFVFLVFKASLSTGSGEQTVGIGCKILKINSFRPIIFDKLQNKRKKKHYYLLVS